MGDCVVWLNSANGGYAEYSVCPASKVYVLPPDLEPGIAAVSFSQGLTALAFIKNSYCVQKADWILVQGAAGGVGIWLCRLLKWVGAKVIAIVSSVEKVQLVAENGANFVLSSKDDDIVTRVLEITEGKGVAAVFDGVGKVTFDMGLQVLARDGTMVTYGNASGNVTGFDVDRLKEKNLRLMRPRVFGYIQTREEFVGFAERLFSYIRGTEGIGVAGGVYPLEEVARAHNDLEGRKAVGKLILKL